jgi:cysteinyl-tRNA synthetase
MAARYLGQPFDIHTGGADLIFPHHENEIAQSEAARDVAFARYWLHHGHVMIRGEEMHKSLRNAVELDEVLERYAPEVVRVFFCSAHYRSQIDYTASSLDEARSVWERFRAFLRITPQADADAAAVDERLSSFREAMDDDLNTPGALAALHEIVSEANRDPATAAVARAAVETALGVLGLDAAAGDTGADVVGPLVELLLEQREQARAAKDFGRADEIRSRLEQIGVRVEDSAAGPRWFLE